MGRRSGQSILEYTILVVVIIAAFLSMQMYVKRGISGRWRSAVDDLGDQYDPRMMNGSIRHSICSDSNSQMIMTWGNKGNAYGYYSVRVDEQSSNETKTGSVQVGN